MTLNCNASSNSGKTELREVAGCFNSLLHLSLYKFFWALCLEWLIDLIVIRTNNKGNPQIISRKTKEKSVAM